MTSSVKALTTPVPLSASLQNVTKSPLFSCQMKKYTGMDFLPSRILSVLYLVKIDARTLP